MKTSIIIALFAFSQLLLAESEVEFRNRIESAYRTQANEDLLNLYHLESLNEDSVEFLKQRVDANFKRETDWKQINVELSPVIHYPSLSYTSRKGKLAYPSIRPTGGTACIRYPKGNQITLIPFAKEGDHYYLVSNNIADIETEEAETFDLQFSVVNGHKIKNLPPMTLTVMASEIVNVYTIPFGGRGGINASRMLSLSSPPIPKGKAVHIRIYDPRDESYVVLDKIFDGRKGIFWTAEAANKEMHPTK